MLIKNRRKVLSLFLSLTFVFSNITFINARDRINEVYADYEYLLAFDIDQDFYTYGEIESTGREVNLIEVITSERVSDVFTLSVEESSFVAEDGTVFDRVPIEDILNPSAELISATLVCRFEGIVLAHGEIVPRNSGDGYADVIISDPEVLALLDERAFQIERAFEYLENMFFDYLEDGISFTTNFNELDDAFVAEVVRYFLREGIEPLNIPRPDIAVSNLRRVGAGLIQARTNQTFTFWFDNIGPVGASRAEVSVYLRGSRILFANLGFMRAGETWDLEFTTNGMIHGNNNIRVEANPNRVIQEMRYDNNSVNGNWHAEGFIDLAILHLNHMDRRTHFPTAIPVWYEFIIANLGTREARNFQVRAEVNGQAISTLNVPLLVDGTGEWVEFGVTYLVPGSMNVRAIADPNNWINDVNRSNNSQTIQTIISQGNVLITLDPTSGRVNPETISRTPGMPFGTLPVPTRAGYSFSGWVGPQGNLITHTSIVPSSSITLWAMWQRHTFTWPVPGAYTPHHRG